MRVLRQVELPPSFDGLAGLQEDLQAYETARARVHEYRRHGAARTMSAQWLAHIDAGLALGPDALRRALGARDRAHADMAPLLARCDALVALSSPGPAPLYADGTGDPIFNRAWTLLGYPSVGMPAPPPAAWADGAATPSAAGSASPLPVGVQLIAERHDDGRLLGAADRAFEALGACCPMPDLST